MLSAARVGRRRGATIRDEYQLLSSNAFCSKYPEKLWRRTRALVSTRRAFTRSPPRLSDVQKLGIQTAIVVGGGNFFRGVAQQAKDMDRVSADHMGMLATVINALALQDALEKQGVFTRVMSAIEMNQVAEPFIRRRAMRHLEKGRVVIFAGGTGNPYFSTDTAASLRAMEIKADAILKATKVDGIYDADPMKVNGARKFNQITYMDVLKLGLKVMDSTAISLCKDNDLPIVIFNLNERGNIRRVILGEKIGSMVCA